MAEFIDRQREFRQLDAILQEQGAHFVLVYGRRRVGKTTLLLNWVQRTGLPYLH
jgi:AAA+ ATPase superfamily predicted ATPase